MRVAPRNRWKEGLFLAGAAALVLAGCSSAPDTQSSGGAAQSGDAKKYTVSEGTDGKTVFTVVTNPNGGAKLTYTADSGFTLLEEEQDGFTYAFKDMNGNGTLDKWEDWRADSQARADDLAPQLTKEQISGLMLFSAHQRTPEDGLTDDQKTFLTDSHVRAVLNAAGNDIEANVKWVNALESYVETLKSDTEPYIPAYFSSDPRSNPAEDQVFFAEAGTTISQWPDNLGMAAIGDAEVTEKMADTQSQEYRALGIQVALGPIVDLASDPRWPRNYGTFGEDPDLASAMGKAYVAGMQTTYDESGSSTGFGPESVQTTIKHFPGDGAAEGGRESHQDQGKYAVYPGGNEQASISVFKSAIDSAAVMLSYSSGVAADGSPAFGGEYYATAYNKAKIDILREDLGFKGVIMTDWGVTDKNSPDGIKPGKTWGITEGWDINEQHYRIIHAGADMFGGNNDIVPVLAAYDRWDQAYAAGEESVDAATRWSQSGARVLNMIFNTGAYESPYLDLEESKAIAGSADKMEAGKEAQMNSVVMLKNANETVTCGAAETDYSKMTVYIPQSFSLEVEGARSAKEYMEGPTLDLELAGKYFGTVVTDEVEYDADGKVVSYKAPDLSTVDRVMIGMRPPYNGGVAQGLDLATNTFIPVSLQYGEYVADGPNVRQVSIAGDIMEDGSKQNRSYYGQTAKISNAADLEAFQRAVEAVKASGKDIPITTIIKVNSGYSSFALTSTIPAEFEPDSDALLISYSVTQEAMFQVALGLHDSAGKLPIGLPDSMDSVEASFEDVPKDQGAYTDASGNSYAFGFGLGCDGKALSD